MSAVDRWLAALAAGETVTVACCPEHGLHGERDTCFECGGPVEQIPMMPAANLSSESFDPDDLVRWADMYGHPEEWAKRAQAASGRAEKHAARVDVLERALRQIGQHPRLAVQIVAEVLGEPLVLDPLSPTTPLARDDMGTLG